MLELTTDSIKDFQICERLYDYRYNDKLLEKVYSRDILANKFELTIKNIIYFFWFKKQGGLTPSYASMLNRWEKLWFPKNTESYDIMIEQHESHYGNMASYTSKAAALLLKFYETYSDSEIIPIGISENYIALINKSVKINDKFDLIYRYNNKNYVVKFLFNYKLKNSFIHQIDFATMYVGFSSQHYEKLKNTSFGYIDLLSNNLQFINYDVSTEDVDSLKFWSTQILEKEMFVPRRGLTSYCKKCPFDKPCSSWTFKSEKD